ncbi:MAG: nucleotidyltransferase domain-containing protein [Halomonas sp.]|uniref:type VII toxin-antitoxin system MntA family adenylyltransferase antitoxin n=1 Tax=Halomonas sp. TaxID=1486246 RepID=UPI002ACEC0B2|nr:nucleotidyltransferase domain-containing protein [Halomonas sp.]MDZ7852765.1 nucleotidyltransferase domain-containing protein [Halomonas sp.]
MPALQKQSRGTLATLLAEPVIRMLESTTSLATSEREHCVTLLTDALPGLQAVYLFGSQVTGDASPQSDVDLAVLLPSPLSAEQRWDLMATLANRLDRDVDLVDLRRATTVMQYQVISEGLRLWSQGSGADEFELAVLSEYWDLQIQRRGLIDDIKQRGTVHGR